MNFKVKQLCSYIFPAVGSLFVTYLYNVMDGIFVGQGIGSSALGAVNIGVPFITFAVAVVSMFPMGGATIIAIRMGRGDKEGANNAFMTAFTLTVLTAVMLTVFGTVFSQQIVDLSGAYKLGNEMRRLSADYLFYYSAFSLPMLMSNCLSVFVRNDGSPILSFIGMCTGAVSNIFLDWLFIFPLQMGVVGAAVASGLGQVFSLLVLLSHFTRKHGDLRIRRFMVQPVLIKKICKRGAPEAVTQLTTPVTALCYNLVLANLMGDIGVSTYSVLSFIYSLANAVLSGVAQGLQPLWGNSYGKQDTKEINGYFRFGMAVNFVLSVLVTAGLILFNELVIRIFSQDLDLINTATKALPVFSLSFIPMALNLVYTSLLYSTKRTKQSDLIAICRGIVVKAIAIFCIPVIWGTKTIWAAPLFAEMITFAIAVVLTRKTKLIYQ